MGNPSSQASEHGTVCGSSTTGSITTSACLTLGCTPRVEVPCVSAGGGWSSPLRTVSITGLQMTNLPHCVLSYCSSWETASVQTQEPCPREHIPLPCSSSSCRVVISAVHARGKALLPACGMLLPGTETSHASLWLRRSADIMETDAHIPLWKYHSHPGPRRLLSTPCAMVFDA